ncbi:hypothetical protein MSIMFI_01842 [Mycobacterium simulans]|nr:hypothetical protein MSIMFI_01842 [Mycobacterium simulans]
MSVSRVQTGLAYTNERDLLLSAGSRSAVRGYAYRVGSCHRGLAAWPVPPGRSVQSAMDRPSYRHKACVGCSSSSDRFSIAPRHGALVDKIALCVLILDIIWLSVNEMRATLRNHWCWSSFEEHANRGRLHRISSAEGCHSAGQSGAVVRRRHCMRLAAENSGRLRGPLRVCRWPVRVRAWRRGPVPVMVSPRR